MAVPDTDQTVVGPQVEQRPSTWRLAGVELALTASLIFVVVLTVRWLVGPATGLPRPGAPLGVLGVLALVVGTLLVVAIESPPGRVSGAHVNPAITVPLWILGLCPGRLVVPYVLAQSMGSVLGAAAAGVVGGRPVVDLDFALIRPAAGVGTPTVLVVEAAVGQRSCSRCPRCSPTGPGGGSPW